VMSNFLNADIPAEGCTRCDCGAKYWDGLICHSCKEPFKPWLYEWDEVDGHVRKECV
jgi:hypothetical protein